jgi:hypothetical protein
MPPKNSVRKNRTGRGLKKDRTAETGRGPKDRTARTKNRPEVKESDRKEEVPRSGGTYSLYYTFAKPSPSEVSSPINRKKLAKFLNGLEDHEKKVAVVMLIAEHAKISGELDFSSLTTLEKTPTLPYGLVLGSPSDEGSVPPADSPSESSESPNSHSDSLNSHSDSLNSHSESCTFDVNSFPDELIYILWRFSKL